MEPRPVTLKNSGHDPRELVQDCLSTQFGHDLKIICKDGNFCWNSLLISRWSKLIRNLLTEDYMALTRRDSIVIMMPGVKVATMELVLNWSVMGSMDLANRDMLNEVMFVLRSFDHDIRVSVESKESHIGVSEAKLMSECQMETNSHVDESGSNIEQTPMKRLKSYQDHCFTQVTPGKHFDKTDLVEIGRNNNNSDTSNHYEKEENCTDKGVFKIDLTLEEKMRLKVKEEAKSEEYRLSLSDKNFNKRNCDESPAVTSGDTDEEEDVNVVDDYDTINSGEVGNITKEDLDSSQIENNEATHTGSSRKISKHEKIKMNWRNLKSDASGDSAEITPGVGNKILTNSQHLAKNRTSSKDKRYKCPLCPKASDTVILLKYHLSGKHFKNMLIKSTNWKKDCQTCMSLSAKESCAFRTRFAVHLGLTHEYLYQFLPESARDALKQMESDTIKRRREEQAKASCPMCPQKCLDLRLLRCHISIMHYRKEIFELAGLRDPISNECPVCDKQLVISMSAAQNDRDRKMARHLGTSHGYLKKLLPEEFKAQLGYRYKFEH